jgi:hypothetical protein
MILLVLSRSVQVYSMRCAGLSWHSHIENTLFRTIYQTAAQCTCLPSLLQHNRTIMHEPLRSA